MSTWSLVSALLAILVFAGCTDTPRLDGDNALSDRALLEAARRPLKAYATGSGQQAADLIDAAESMRARLDGEGYAMAKVSAQPGSPPSFTIDSGPRVALAAVICTGDTGLGANELTAAIASGPWYTSATATEVRAQALRTLRTAGHLLATVAAPTETWEAGQARVELVLAVQAGPRFVLGSTTLELVADSDPLGHWEGLVAGLTSLLEPPGSLCQPHTPGSTAARLRGHLIDLGYRDAVVEVRQRLSAEGARVDLVAAVQPGRVHVVRSIDVQGGARSSRSFVASRLAELTPGQPLSQAALDHSVSALLTTGRYRLVEAAPKVSEVQPDGRVADDVEVVLRELPSQRLDFSLGYGTYERYRGGVLYVDDHLFGQGLRFSTGVEVSTVGWEAVTSLMDPFRFGPGRRMTLDLDYRERQEPSFSHREASLGLTFDRRFSPTFDPVPWQLRTGYRFSRAEDYSIEAVSSGDQSDPLYSTSMFSVELRRDTRQPRLLDPDSGTLSRVLVGWSPRPTGATVDYTEIAASWSGAWSPAPWLVTAVRGSWATRDPGVVTSLPIGERLFMGGSDTVRSFTQDDLGPRSASGQPLGGLSHAVTNLELRWRPLVEHREMELATFFDLGTVDPEAWRLGAPWGAGVGAGLRYRTPVGPVRFDAAVNPGDTLGAEQRWALNLTVGFAF